LNGTDVGLYWWAWNAYRGSVIPAEDRVLAIPQEDRNVIIPYEDRVFAIPACDNGGR